ncbi:DUF1223 domain-containing protein [Bosea sp. PAMC 26642]|uniref:DUF1223 domain-containing protein n=1 Tax=Bosea sp. (strain PAMC 26642) TaxID=1792307 RepID=UPI000770273E|nr:DUF1223 domain-containing protein [Bosea sp. PAMC 26642]AMJ62117.1 hypothetical protein AXW83_19075 [Bosea sp. PAMC 26642]
MITRSGLLLASCAALLWGGSAAHAQAPVVQPKAVVELFTSQGCSSCPPADALFGELAKDPGILALTLPVTYWDYLGWKDTLGQDAFTKRQKFYAKARGDGQVYTPQAVINGAGHFVGSDRSGIEPGLRQTTLTATIALAETDDALRIGLSGSVAVGDKPAGIWVLPITRIVTVPIGRGENEGRTVSYANVVRGLVRVGDWDGKETTLSVPLTTTRAANADSYVVVVQAEQAGKYGMMPGAILGAARAAH